MPKLSNTALVARISEALTELQTHLIERKQSGRTEDQCVVATVHIDHEELRKLTGRQRIKSAFIDALISRLEDEGLVVDYSDISETLSITRNAEDLEGEYDSLRELTSTLKRLRAA